MPSSRLVEGSGEDGQFRRVVDKVGSVVQGVMCEVEPRPWSGW